MSLSRLLILCTLAGGLAGAGLLLLTDRPPAPDSLAVPLAGKTLTVPRALLREGPDTPDALGRITLALTFPDFAPLPPPDAAGRQPGAITVTIGPAEPGLAPEDRPRQLYAKFLAGEVWSNPGGLVMRRFRPGTPYEDEELYLALPDERRFAARCPRNDLPDAGVEEACLWQMRLGDIDVTTRFAPRHLVEWPRLREGVLALMERLGAGGER